LIGLYFIYCSNQFNIDPNPILLKFSSHQNNKVRKSRLYLPSEDDTGMHVKGLMHVIDILKL